MIESEGLSLVLIIIISSTGWISGIIRAETDIRAHTESRYSTSRKHHTRDLQGSDSRYIDESGLLVSRVSEQVVETVHSLEQTRGSLNEIADGLARRSQPHVDRVLAAVDLSEQCSRDLLQAIGSARSQQRWAFQLFSSWGKLLTGITEARTVDTAGSYADCMSVQQSDAIGHSHYCSMQYQPLLPDIYRYNWIMDKNEETFSRLLVGNWSRPTEPARCDAPEQSRDALGSWTTGMLARSEKFQEIEWGTCFPIGCSPFDVQKIAYYLGHQVALRVASVRCSSTHQAEYNSANNRSKSLVISSLHDLNDGIYIWEPQITRSQLVSLAILGILTFMIALSTLIDILLVRAPEWLSERDETTTIAQDGPSHGRSALSLIGQDFSILRNFERLFDLARAKGEGQILCINGLRCIATSLVISNHLMMHEDISFSSLSIFCQFLIDCNWLKVFFIISGFVNALTTFKERRGVDARESFSLKVYTIGRYLRLLPQVLLTTAIVIILPMLSDKGSSRWHKSVGRECELCSEQWWTQILFIQSFFIPRCNGVTWYLTADMIFHLSALIVVYLAFNHERRAVHIVCSLIIPASTIASALSHHSYGLGIDPYQENPNLHDNEYSTHKFEYHLNPVNHLLPYFSGLYLGYILATDEEKIRTLLTRRRAQLAWISIIGLLIVQHCVLRYSVLGTSIAPPLPTVLWTIKQLIWTSFFLWTIVACSLGLGGWINKWLSCKLFVVLGRASYMIYLVQYLVIFGLLGTSESVHWQNRVMLPFLVIGAVVLTTMLGSAMCIIFELPWLQLHKKIVRRIR